MHGTYYTSRLQSTLHEHIFFILSKFPITFPEIYGAQISLLFYRPSALHFDILEFRIWQHLGFFHTKDFVYQNHKSLTIF